MEWVRHFIRFPKLFNDKNVVVTMDGCITRTENVDAISLACGHEIMMLSLSTHASTAAPSCFIFQTLKQQIGDFAYPGKNII